MSQLKSSLSLFSMSIIVALGFFAQACGGTTALPSHISSTPTAMHSPLATQPIVRTMRVDMGGYKLYIQCMGQGNPTVVFDAGLGDDSSTWGHVQPQVAHFTQACAFDRAGEGQSDMRPASVKISAQQVAKELHILLANGNIPGPYVLVGHSWGGLLVQMYACLYAHEMAGIVLLDSTHPEQAKRLAAALGPEYSKQVQQGWQVVEGLSYDGALAMQAQVDAVKRQFPNVPLLVLMRSRFTSSASWTAEQYRKVWLSLQTELAMRSSKGKLIVAQNSSHFIQMDRPDLVIQAIQEVVMETRHP